jgi:hypothetical protein
MSSIAAAAHNAADAVALCWVHAMVSTDYTDFIDCERKRRQEKSRLEQIQMKGVVVMG